MRCYRCKKLIPEGAEAIVDEVLKIEVRGTTAKGRFVAEYWHVDCYEPPKLTV